MESTTAIKKTVTLNQNRTKKVGRFKMLPWITLGFKYASLILGSFIVVFPIWAVFITAFKGRLEFNTTSRLTLPESFFEVENFIRFTTEKPFFEALGNTLMIVGVSLIFIVLFNSMAAFCLSRFQFRLKKWIIGLYSLGLVLPVILTQVSTYMVLHFFGLVGTYTGMVVMYSGVNVINIFIYVQFMKEIPTDLDESAYMDGASLFTVFWRIIFPLLKPATGTVLVLSSITLYNDYYTAFLYMPSGEYTVSTLLMDMSNQFSFDSRGVMMAGTISVVIPSILFFLSMQKRIYAGITKGAVKG